MIPRSARAEGWPGWSPEAARQFIAAAPPGTLVPVEAVQALIDAEPLPPRLALESTAPAPPDPQRWTPERLWSAPDETRINLAQLCEAVGRPESWAYKRTGPKATDPIPHRKLEGGLLVFVVGEVRHWLFEHEDIVCAGPIRHADQ